MHTETDYLKKIAEEIAANSASHIHATVPDHRLMAEAGHLEREIRYELLTIENFTRRDTFHYDTLLKLVEICDLLFDIDHTVNPNVSVMLGLLNAVKQIIPAEIRPGLRLPKAFILLQKSLFAESWDSQLAVLETQEIESNLIDIAEVPFKAFMEPKHRLYWGNYTWLKAYERKLEAMDWVHSDCNSKTEALVSLLIASGLNDDRFFIYCKNIIVDRLALKNGRKEKLRELANCRKLVLQDSRHKNCPYNPKVDPLVTQLLVWITAEEEYVNVHEGEHPFAKLSFQFYKYTLAFFFKLLHEQKVFGDITFRELTEQIASTCTAMGADVPAPSISKKAYPYKQVDFKRMETLLVAMLEYLRRFM